MKDDKVTREPADKAWPESVYRTTGKFTAYGDTPAEIELAAVAAARKFYGPDAWLVVRSDWSSVESDLDHRSADPQARKARRGSVIISMIRDEQEAAPWAR